MSDYMEMRQKAEEIQQRTNSWHKWRSKGIGASEAAAVMRASPWQTPYQLWELKTGRAKPFEGNYATNIGNEYEPVARACYELMADVECPPCLMVHPEFDFIRASLDGYNPEASLVLEIKVPGKVDHEKARLGEVPEKYQWQLQHQLMVTGADKAHYFSYDRNAAEGIIVEVLPDPEKQKQLLKELTTFWEYVKSDTPPPLGPKDYVQIRDGETISLAQQYQILKRSLDEIQLAMDEIKTKIIEKHKDHDRFQCGPLQVCRTVRKGAVNYTAIPELKNIDLEKYRKKDTVTVTFTVKTEVPAE